MKDQIPHLDRRRFLKFSALTTSLLCAGPLRLLRAATDESVPSYLANYAALYRVDPHAAALAWFADAEFGMFMHYGPYSLFEGEWEGEYAKPAEWIMFERLISIENYENVAAQFNPKNFDADYITDLALAAGMKYVTFTAKHHDGFCLFDNGKGKWNSVTTSGRDLCAELSEQCQKKGLGCFFYYSLFADWHHPYFFPYSYNYNARPHYPTTPEQYKYETDEDFVYYINDSIGDLRTLLSNYGPIAGIWFDPVIGYHARPDLFPVDDIYAMIREMQPQCLISAKQGANGQEDFIAPERDVAVSMVEKARKRFGADSIPEHSAERATNLNKGKLAEICDTLQPYSWGHSKADNGKHKSAEDVLVMLQNARERNANLLLNTGPLPDGSIHPEDIETFTRLGRLKQAQP